MNEDRKDSTTPGGPAQEAASEDEKKNLASRARNRTVMLTPEMTGHVRSLLEHEGVKRDPLSDLLPSVGGDYERPKTASTLPPIADNGEGFRPRSSSGIQNRGIPGQPGYSSANFQVNSGGTPVSAVTGLLPPRPNAKAAAQPQSAVMARAATSKIIGFLVSFDKDPFGEIFELRAGRFLLTSRAIDHGDYVLINDETISPLHAIVRATEDGKIQILDQLSEFGTGITRVGSQEEQEISGSMTNASHGDKLRFGKRHFTVCIVP